MKNSWLKWTDNALNTADDVLLGAVNGPQNGQWVACVVKLSGATVRLGKFYRRREARRAVLLAVSGTKLDPHGAMRRRRPRVYWAHVLTQAQRIEYVNGAEERSRDAIESAFPGFLKLWDANQLAQARQRSIPDWVQTSVPEFLA